MSLPKSIIVTFCFLLILELFSLWFFLVPNEQRISVIPYVNLINSLAQLFIVILYFRYINLKGLLKIQNTRIIFYVIAIGAAIVFVLLQPFLGIIYYLNFSIDILPSGLDLNQLKSIDTFTLIFIVPITEELFFRSFIQKGLQENYKHKKAIIVTALLFSFIHIPFSSIFFETLNFSLYRSYIAFFGGIISGMLFYKSKSLGPSMIFHGIWNFLIIMGV